MHLSYRKELVKKVNALKEYAKKIKEEELPLKRAWLSEKDDRYQETFDAETLRAEIEAADELIRGIEELNTDDLEQF
jgi:hypothetical protein